MSRLTRHREDTDMNVIGGIGGALRTMASRAAAARRERHTERVLATLPRHLLQDIGFERGFNGSLSRTRSE